MPNQCITDIVSVLEKRIDTGFEIGLEQEILLADYDKPVFKIIKTITDHSITQKYINGNRLIIEGFFRTSVFYQPPMGESITVVSKKQTFQKQLEVQNPVTDVHFIDISGELQYINTRAINPTRISFNGVYQFNVVLYTAESIPVTTAVNSSTVCTDSDSLTFFCLQGQGSRQFSLEEELRAGEKADKILHITTHPVNVTAFTYEDKVNIKGDIEAEIVFSAEDSDLLQTVKKKFLFSQVTDIQGTAETHVAYAQLSVISTTVTANQNTGKINCIITAVADVRVFRKNNVISVSDAFSKKYTTEKKCGQMQYHRNILSVNKTFAYTVEDTVGSGYTPVYSFISLSAPRIDTKDGRHTLKSKAYISAIVINSQKEYECFTKTSDVFIDIGKEINPQDKYFLDCTVADKNLYISGQAMKLDFTVDINGFVLCAQNTEVLQNFTERVTSPLENRENSLVLYYASKGEKIFDIAMRYHTDTSLIMTENGLSDLYLDSEKMLIIPSFEM